MALISTNRHILLLICSAVVSATHFGIANADTVIASNTKSGPAITESVAVETLLVSGYRINPLGEKLSASEGTVGSEEIANRPLLRTGEILEFVPGMVVTQHSGSGKANQYFLRGFNLDHGTDFNSTIDGMPINMRTHGHGQGYTDLNFIIPEFINTIDYRKGPYYAEVSDFSGAGAANFSMKDKLDESLLSFTGGQDHYGRLLASGEVKVADGLLLLGAEKQVYDGPWSMVNEDVNKSSFMGRYLTTASGGDFSLTLMAYSNEWNSADQIPARSVDQHLIDRLGSLDKGVGGKSDRYSLSSTWHNEAWFANLYAVNSSLDLFSDFTYFLEDPVNGDQFEQVDDRSIFGGQLKHTWNFLLDGRNANTEVGSEFRYDKIGEVALYHTVSRQRVATRRHDAVDEGSLGVFAQTSVDVSDKLNVHVGARYDFYNADVTSNVAANSGSAHEGKPSVKAGMSYKFSEHFEGYFNAGQGFHSNDVRGATITLDPVTLDPSERVDMLVPSTGAEVGVKLFDEDRFNLSTSFWYLHSNSELVFVGDAGNTEASRASSRYGTEIAGYYWIDSVWNLDMELARTLANYTENADAEGKYVEGSVPFVASLGITYGAQATGFHSSLRYRFFGARKMDSFDEHKADATKTVNLGLGYRFKYTSVELEVLNLFDSENHDIDYFYTSRLQGEPAEGVDDIHYHPVEPRTVRLKMEYRF